MKKTVLIKGRLLNEPGQPNCNGVSYSKEALEQCCKQINEGNLCFTHILKEQPCDRDYSIIDVAKEVLGNVEKAEMKDNAVWIEGQLNTPTSDIYTAMIEEYGVDWFRENFVYGLRCTASTIPIDGHLEVSADDIKLISIDVIPKAKTK